MAKWEETKEMVELRRKGVAYNKIAEDYGITTQDAFIRIKRYEEKLQSKKRGHGFKIDTIIYKGFYEHFKDNIDESICKFCGKAMSFSDANVKKLRDCITGYRNPYWTIQEIKGMCKATGKSFEELFELR